MTRRRRILNIITGLVTLLVGILLFIDTVDGLKVVAFILSLTFTLRGLRTLIYYFSMARYMVGGKMMLYIGMIFLDLGILTTAMDNNPGIYIVLYLMVIHIFSGLIDILRGIENRRLKAPWAFNIVYGVSNISIAAVVLIGGFFMHSVTAVVYIYAAGLIYTAFIRIAGAFRKQAIVYIQ